MPDFRQVMVGGMCRRLAPRHIFLAGGRTPALGDMLANEAIAAGATLHIASASRQAWQDALRKRAGDRVVLHVASPADMIAVMPVPDICWVDADPNWYATTAILRALATQAARRDRPFPVTILENAGWPYGRRDSYDDPAAIPDSVRQPHERAGLLPGQSAPAGSAGLFAGRYNASSENEPGNGVLTAIEDFMADQTGALRLVTLPGFGGLAAITPRGAPGAAAFAAAALAEFALTIAAALETRRLEQAVALQERDAAVRRAESLAVTLRAALDRAAQDRFAMIPPRVRGALRPAVRTARRLMRGRQEDMAPSENAADIARLRASPVFDAAWYLHRYGDVAAAGLDPATHYLRDGAAEGRDPGPHFSTTYYLSTYQDVAEAGLNPLLHYLAGGAAEGRDPSPDFQTARYREQHPGMAAGGLTPLEHFISQGAPAPHP